MKLEKTYRAKEALPLMGIPCTPSTADAYIRNMREFGLLSKSFKSSGRWVIPESDIVETRPIIMNGDYKPSAQHKKAA